MEDKIITIRLNESDLEILKKLKTQYKNYVSPFINIKNEPTTTAVIKWCILNTYTQQNN